MKSPLIVGTLLVGLLLAIAAVCVNLASSTSFLITEEALSHRVTHRYYDHAVQATFGLEDLDTLLLEFERFEPEGDRKAFVRKPIPPDSAKVVLNSMSYPFVKTESGKVVVRVPSQDFHFGGGVQNDLSIKAFGAEGEQVLSVHYEDFRLSF